MLKLVVNKVLDFLKKVYNSISIGLPVGKRRVANVTPVFCVDDVILQCITDTGSSERGVTAIFSNILHISGDVVLC